jgi:hypothetical protein
VRRLLEQLLRRRAQVIRLGLGRPALPAHLLEERRDRCKLRARVGVARQARRHERVELRRPERRRGQRRARVVVCPYSVRRGGAAGEGAPRTKCRTVSSSLSGQGIPPFMRISMQQIPNEYASICQVRLLWPIITSGACQRSVPSAGTRSVGCTREKGRGTDGAEASRSAGMPRSSSHSARSRRAHSAANRKRGRCWPTRSISTGPTLRLPHIP